MQSIILSHCIDYLLDYPLPISVNPIVAQQQEQWMSSSLCPVMTSSPLKQEALCVTASCNVSHSDDDIPLSQAEANSFFSEENEIDIDDTSDLILSNKEIESFFNDSFESEDTTLTQAADHYTVSETEEVTLTQAEIDSFFAAEEDEVEIPELDLLKEEISSFCKSFFSSDSD